MPEENKNCPFVHPRICKRWDNGCPYIAVDGGKGVITGIETCPCPSKMDLVPVYFECKTHGPQGTYFEITTGKNAEKFCPECLMEKLEKIGAKLHTVNIEE